jgi:hypothetical protein
MPLDIEFSDMEIRERAYLAARDAAYYAISERVDDIFSTVDEAAEVISKRIGRDKKWVLNALSGPNGWSMKTFGEIAYGMGGLADLKIEINTPESLPRDASRQANA